MPLCQPEVAKNEKSGQKVRKREKFSQYPYHMNQRCLVMKIGRDANDMG